MIVSWNTTNKCNMHCKHCYRDSGIKAADELSTDEAKKLIDDIAASGFKIMIFSGGEPLMREDIYELTQYATSKSLRAVLGSNGTLITKSVATALKNSGVKGIGISLDSLNPKKHDVFRTYEGGWRATVRGMRSCREAELPFQIHTTVMKWNKDEILDMTDFAVGMGAVAHHTFFMVPTGRGLDLKEQSLEPEEYESLLKDIMMKQKEVDIELKPTCAPQFMRIAKMLGMNPRFGRGCLAGTNYCIISPTGDLQPCAYLNMPIGNVRSQSFCEIWSNNIILRELRSLDYKGKCGICSFKKSCGGCRARAAFYSNGDYMASENMCLYPGYIKEEIING